MMTGNHLLQSKIHEDNPRNLCPTQHRNFDKAFVRKNPLRSRRASSEEILIVEGEELMRTKLQYQM